VLAEPLPVAVPGTLGAQGQHRAGCDRQQRGGIAPAAAGDRLRLHLVHDQQVDRREQVGGQLPGRGRVEHHPGAGRLRRPHGLRDGVQRDLQLADQHVGGRDRGDLRRLETREGAVRAGGGDDGVLAGRIDHDHRDAGRPVDHPQVARVDAGRRQPGLQGDAEGVGADRAQECAPGAGPHRGDRLVGALAAGDHREVVAQHGLAGQRQGRRGGHQVHVRAADDRDARPAAGPVPGHRPTPPGR
jgi:hypothetical protein